MAKSIRGSATERNVALAFANESMTVNRYSIFSRLASSEGLKQAAEAFAAVSEQEKRHAEALFKFFEGGTIELTLHLPAVPAGTARANLENSLAVEKAAWSVRYPEFARTAREEGFPAIADAFESFAADERAHEEAFTALLKNLPKE